MPLLVFEYLLANRGEHRRSRRTPQGFVVNLGDQLRRDENRDGDLQRTQEVAEPAKHAIADRRPRERDLVELEKAGELTRVALLFANEEANCDRVLVVAGAARERVGVPDEASPLPTLSALEFGNGTRKVTSLVGSEVGATIPRDGDQLRGIAFEDSFPTSGRSHR